VSGSLRIARVVLRVTDVHATADFYGRVAGLAPDGLEEGGGMLSAPGGGPALLELHRAERPGPAPRRAAGLFHTALRFPERPQLGAALRRLATQRIPLTGASHHYVSEALYLDDPDALGIELYWDLPRDEWPTQPDGRPTIGTVPLDLDAILAAGEPSGGESDGVDVGHVHLKVSAVEEGVRFWTQAIGLDLQATVPQAGFLASGGYHHHVGVNAWFSDGAALEPADGPGLDAVVCAVAGDPGLEAARARLEAAEVPVEAANGRVSTRTPDGVAVVLEAE
jgi:catechol 2,3-dioxygenase